MKVQTEVVQGRPLDVEGRHLVPVARRTSGIRRRATISTGVTGRGGGFVHLRPIGVVEQQGEEQSFIPIPDQTAQALWGMLAAAVIVPLLLILAARLARR